MLEVDIFNNKSKIISYYWICFIKMINFINKLKNSIYFRRTSKMESIVINENKCNYEFKIIVNNKANELIKKGFIIERIKYKKRNGTDRYKSAIINYISRV